MRIKMLNFITLFAVGGTERQFVNVTRELDRSQFDVHVGCLARKGTFLKDIEAMNVPISEYSIKRLHSYRTLRCQYRLAQDIRRQGIQLVHAHGFYPNVFSIPAAKLAGCLTVASVRDTGAFSNCHRLRTQTQKLVCRMADTVIVNSGAVRDWLVSVGVPAEHIHVIPNGIVVPPQKIPSGHCPIRRELNIDDRAPVIAVVSRLDRGKGLEYFIQASVGVSRRFPSARFMVVGDSVVDPAYKPELETLATRLNMSGRIIFTGERSDVPQLLEEVNVCVLPSLSEGFSNSLIEAMAAGLPVVATMVGGNPEIVQDNKTGILVPPRDSLSLENAIIQILESPSLAQQFGNAGRERVTTLFSLQSTVRKTQDLYLSLIEKRAPRIAA